MPQIVRAIISKLSISVIIHAWGEELYTDPIPVDTGAENPKPLVDKMDDAPAASMHAICSSLGLLPLEKNGEIRPCSPVNVIGTMSKNAVSNSTDGAKATFQISR